MIYIYIGGIYIFHGLHGFALDQPSINGIGPINRSEKMKRSETVGHSRKRSETVGNMIRPNLVQPAFLLNKHFRAKPFFFWRSKGVQGETVGNSRRSHSVSDRFMFSERLIGPIPFIEGWSSANPCKPWRFSFLAPPLCAYTAPNIASWPWYPIFPKNHKIPGAREI